MKENKAQMRGIKYLWHNLEYILAAVFFVIMLVALFIQVFFRFVLNNPIGWTEELAVTCFVMMVYIGSIGATRNDEHMKMEMVINLFGPKGRLVMLIIGDVVFAVANLILAYGIFTVSLNLKKYGMTTAMLHIPKWIPYMVLPEILSIGVLAGAVTELVLPPKDMEKWEGMLRRVVHYVLITLGVLVCGWLYGWYELSVVGVLAMCLTSAAVYLFTSALNYQIYKKTAEQMNEKLKEHHKKIAGSPVVSPKEKIDHEKKA